MILIDMIIKTCAFLSDDIELAVCFVILADYERRQNDSRACFRYGGFQPRRFFPPD